jgi:heme-degrading monooxygenase HmoA
VICKELDYYVALRDQFTVEASPVVLVIVFQVNPSESKALIRAWAGAATYLKGLQGFISTRLHRGIAGSGTFVNYAVWESVRHCRDAFHSVELQRRLSAIPADTVASLHLFEAVQPTEVRGEC